MHFIHPAVTNFVNILLLTPFFTSLQKLNLVGPVLHLFKKLQSRDYVWIMQNSDLILLQLACITCDHGA